MDHPDASARGMAGLQEPVAHLASSAHPPRRDWRFVVAISVAVLLLLGAGWFAYEAHANEQAAGDWREQAIGLEEQVNGLRALIGERSAQLNERTRQGNRLADNLRSTRSALRRSEGDVTSLARRQRELASEKAQLEDQRRALQQMAGDLVEIASRYIACKSSLIDVINALIDEDYSSASYEIDIANSRCDSAASALNMYVAAYE
jgi:chromosome segregation ATPase